jgi:hypothetical protein
MDQLVKPLLLVLALALVVGGVVLWWPAKGPEEIPLPLHFRIMVYRPLTEWKHEPGLHRRIIEAATGANVDVRDIGVGFEEWDHGPLPRLVGFQVGNMKEERGVGHFVRIKDDDWQWRAWKWVWVPLVEHPVFGPHYGGPYVPVNKAPIKSAPLRDAIARTIEEQGLDPSDVGIIEYAPTAPQGPGPRRVLYLADLRKEKVLGYLGLTSFPERE